MPTALGNCTIVLHGHLPYVHHPRHPEFLEEDWYLEAVLDTYLPLLASLEALAEVEIPVRLSAGFTPPLLEMMRAPALRAKTDGWLLRKRQLAEEEVRRLRGDPQHGKTAAHYLKRFADLRALWTKVEGDLPAAFRRHQEEGRLEILASAGTHAVLPLLHTDAAKRLQIRLGCALYEEVFGLPPSGFWLPECAYAPGLDRLLAEAGIRWVVLETHGVTGAMPPPTTGVYAPLLLPAGVAAFGRDLASSRQVWAQEVGYPGDPAYRELYRDLGYDGDYSYVKRWLHGDGVRRNLGLKYHRVTGRVELDAKEPYDVAAAEARALVHAGNFAFNRGVQSEALREEIGRPPVIVSPYDMELFGHWWYEGPWFLENIFRVMADETTRAKVRFRTPSDVLRDGVVLPRGEAGLSTWGEGGFLKVWMNEKNAWVLRHQHELERRMLERLADHPQPTAAQSRLLDQMLRELLLLQSSDWAFIITKETSVHYARKRVTDHVDRFLRLHDALADPAALDPGVLEEIEEVDAIFPGLDHRALSGGALTKPGVRLGTPPPAH